MLHRAMTTLAVAALVSLTSAASWAQLSTYSQNFESMNQADPAALSSDGWKVFGNVFDAGFNWIYGYGVYAAPNNPGAPAFCLVAAGQGGAPQGAQQLVAFNDYNNADHLNFPTRIIESNVFQEQTIGAGDVGNTWVFQWDAKLGDLGGSSTASAFIKTLDPNNGYATTNFLQSSMTAIPATWGTYFLSLTITPGLVGQLFQIGFLNTASGYSPSGVFYDNINFAVQPTVAVEETTWGATKALYR